MRLRRLCARRRSCAPLPAACSSGRALAAAAAPLATRPRRRTPPSRVSDAHFIVWYTDDPTATDYITQTQAGDLAASAERAYASFAAHGLPGACGRRLRHDRHRRHRPVEPGTSRARTATAPFDVRLRQRSASTTRPWRSAWDVFRRSSTASSSPTVPTDIWLQHGGGAVGRRRRRSAIPAASIADIGPLGHVARLLGSRLRHRLLANCSTERLREPRPLALAVLRVPRGAFGTTFIDEVLTDAAGRALRLHRPVERASPRTGRRFTAALQRLDDDGARRARTRLRLQGPSRPRTRRSRPARGAVTVASLRSRRPSRDPYVEFDRGDGDRSRLLRGDAVAHR